MKKKAFPAVTLLAVLVSALLIVLGRVSAAQNSAVNPISSPASTYKPVPSFTTPPVTVTASPSTTEPPGTPVTVSPSPAPSSTSAAALPLSSVSKGLPAAPVTIIEYSDFQCSHCQQFALTVEKELEAAYIDTGKVRLIFKFIAGFGEESRRANIAAASAAEQGQFWNYYYLLMQQRASPKVDDLPAEKLQEMARLLGLDMEQFNRSFLSGRYAAWVDYQDAEGRNLGINSTPTFFINGIKKAGARTLQDLAEIIEPLLEQQAK